MAGAEEEEGAGGPLDAAAGGFAANVGALGRRLSEVRIGGREKVSVESQPRTEKGGTEGPNEFGKRSSSPPAPVPPVQLLSKQQTPANTKLESAYKRTISQKLLFSVTGCASG